MGTCQTDENSWLETQSLHQNTLHSNVYTFAKHSLSARFNARNILKVGRCQNSLIWC